MYNVVVTSLQIRHHQHEARPFRLMMVDSEALIHSVVNATSSGRAAVLFMSNRIIVQSCLHSHFLEHVVRVIEF